MEAKKITILGIGCTLLADQGFGVAVVQALSDRFEFQERIQLVDGGLIGVGLTGTIARADHLIVIDAMFNDGNPGDIYRLEGRQILERLAGKNHVPQVEFLEALAHCQALDHPPHTVLLGIEPSDTRTLACELTPVLTAKMDAMIARVLEELDRLGAKYRKKEEKQTCV